MVTHPIIQIIISLIILLLMGYVAYNIYLIELKHMFKGNNDIRKEVDILKGIYDYSLAEAKYNTVNKSHEYFIDIAPSINQEGGAEYSYNFWLYVDQNKITKLKQEGSGDFTENKKDIVLFFKGEKKFYFNDNGNYNCNYKSPESVNTGSDTGNYVNLITKNPLVRINSDGTSLAIDYNNILSPDSYQNNSLYKKCDTMNSVNDWNEKNKNMLGVYDITFNNKWFMVTVVIKEVADNNNILTKNRAICKLYINGMLIFESKAETIYGGSVSSDNIYSATLKNNKSPFYINPTFDDEIGNPDKNPFFNISKSNYASSDDKRQIGNILKIADLKYFNYAISLDMITNIYRSGFTKEIVTSPTVTKLAKHYLLSQYELDNNTVKEL